MNAEEINQQIAELCGWKWRTVYCGIDGSSRQHLTPPNGDLHESPPDFYGSLDCCAQFEASLTDEEAKEYVLALQNQRNCVGTQFIGLLFVSLVRPTAPQRCLAFLAVKGITPPASGLTE